MPRKKIQVEESSGNVFSDLGCKDPNDRRAKAQLGLCISKIIETHGWKQREAAEHMGIDQPKVSRLLRGQLREFSIERLMGFLRMLGWNVEIVLSEARSPSEAGFRVVEASG